MLYSKKVRYFFISFFFFLRQSIRNFDFFEPVWPAILVTLIFYMEIMRHGLDQSKGLFTWRWGTPGR